MNLKKTPHPLFVGHLQGSNVNITIEESNLILSKEIEVDIERRWSEKIKEAEEGNLNLYNGMSYRLNDWSCVLDRLDLKLSVFDYKHRHALVCMSREGSIDEGKYRHNGCYVGATVITSDNKYVMVKLSGKSMNPNKTDLLGGIAETNVKCNSGQYLFDILHEELREEAGLEINEVDSSVLRMMYASQSGHIGFYFEIRLLLSSGEMEERFADNQDIDIAHLLFYEKSEYVNALRRHGSSKNLIADCFENKV